MNTSTSKWPPKWYIFNEIDQSSLKRSKYAEILTQRNFLVNIKIFCLQDVPLIYLKFEKKCICTTLNVSTNTVRIAQRHVTATSKTALNALNIENK